MDGCYSFDGWSVCSVERYGFLGNACEGGNILRNGCNYLVNTGFWNLFDCEEVNLTKEDKAIKARLSKETVAEIIELIEKGVSTSVISECYDIDEATVRYHRKSTSLYTKRGPSKKYNAKPETAFDYIGCDDPTLAIYSAHHGYEFDLRSVGHG